MQKLRSERDVEAALRRLRRYQVREAKYRRLYEKYRNLVVRYMETNNKKVVTGEDGAVWQKRQVVIIKYPDDGKALRSLLRKKGVDPKEVVRYETVTHTVVEEEEILRLLKRKIITAAEYEKVIIRQTHTPFLARLNGKKKQAGGTGRSKDPARSKKGI